MFKQTQAAKPKPVVVKKDVLSKNHTGQNLSRGHLRLSKPERGDKAWLN